MVDARLGRGRVRARAWLLGAGSRYKIVSWLRGGDHVSLYRVARGCDTATVRHYTAQYALPGSRAHGLGAVGAQLGSGCAPGAPNQVLDSVH